MASVKLTMIQSHKGISALWRSLYLTKPPDSLIWLQFNLEKTANLPAANHEAELLQCERRVRLINTPGFNTASALSDQINQSQSTAIYCVGEQTCTVGQREGHPPRWILTREMNCREEEEKKGWRWRWREGEMGRWHPAMRAERRVKTEKTLEKNWRHGERHQNRRTGRRQTDGGVKIKETFWISRKKNANREMKKQKKRKVK